MRSLFEKLLVYESPVRFLKIRTCCIWLISHQDSESTLSLTKEGLFLSSKLLLGLGDTGELLCDWLSLRVHVVLSGLGALIRIIRNSKFMPILRVCVNLVKHWDPNSYASPKFKPVLGCTVGIWAKLLMLSLVSIRQKASSVRKGQSAHFGTEV